MNVQCIFTIQVAVCVDFFLRVGESPLSLASRDSMTSKSSIFKNLGEPKTRTYFSSSGLLSTGKDPLSLPGILTMQVINIVK